MVIKTKSLFLVNLIFLTFPVQTFACSSGFSSIETLGSIMILPTLILAFFEIGLIRKLGGTGIPTAFEIYGATLLVKGAGMFIGLFPLFLVNFFAAQAFYSAFHFAGALGILSLFKDFKKENAMITALLISTIIPFSFSFIIFVNNKLFV